MNGTPVCFQVRKCVYITKETQLSAVRIKAKDRASLFLFNRVVSQMNTRWSQLKEGKKKKKDLSVTASLRAARMFVFVFVFVFRLVFNKTIYFFPCFSLSASSVVPFLFFTSFLGHERGGVQKQKAAIKSIRTHTHTLSLSLSCTSNELRAVRTPSLPSS